MVAEVRMSGKMSNFAGQEPGFKDLQVSFDPGIEKADFQVIVKKVIAKMEGETRKLFIETYGCQMNVADSEVIASIMRMAGYEPTDNIDEADAIFLNTCSIRENAEQKIWNRLDALYAMKKRKNSLSRITKCAARALPSRS